jgi:SAM-dependent methyltransferase
MSDPFEDELQHRASRLASARDDNSFLSLWRETLAWLGDADHAQVSMLIGTSGHRYQGFFAAFQRRYLTIQEKDVAERLFATDASAAPDLERLLQIPFARQAYDRVAEALVLVDFGTCQLFVNIGCGPFPAAALLVHERTNVPRIVAVDNDPTAVELCSNVVRRVASPRVEVVHADGSTYDFKEADVIYVANHVVPKGSVVQRIGETASPGTKVLVREPCGVGFVLAEQGCDLLPASLHVLSKGADDLTFHSRHVLCERLSE